MILILLSSILILSALSGLGKAMESFAGTLNGIAGKILAGILTVSTLWTMVSFFIPLDIYVEMPVIMIGLLFFFKERLYIEWYRFLKKDIFLFSAVTLIILFCSSYYPYILDHFGYYVPSIKWLSEYGLIKGISNLDLSLGQMSVWHIFQAGFSNFSDPFLRINAIILLVYSIYIIEKQSWIQLLFIPVMLLFSQSPSPDLPVIIFSLVILNEIISGNAKASHLFLFSAFVFAIKPTMIWLPILVLSYSAFIIKPTLKTLIPGFLLILLFFLKNIWTFGYPIFPVPVGDIGVYWKPNPEVLKISSQYAIQKTYDMQYSYEEIQQFTSSDYIKNWLFLNGIKSKINILLILGLIGFSIFSWRKKDKMAYLIAGSLLIKSILVLLFSAQYRFFLDVFFVIFFVIFFKYFNRQKALLIFSAMSIAVILFLSFPAFIATHLPSYKMASFMGKFEKEQLYKPSVYEPTSFSTFKIGNLEFNVSKNYPYNFETPLPAISPGYLIDDIKTDIVPQLIHKNTIQKGFFWKTMIPAERKQAEHIINCISNTDQ
ncbi:membrane protein [Chryseobacterium piperi]|uniref:Membrane protein n=1 Tax=Chryseobacterium piperi TaxID=558152 RepID=A0A086AKL2_9FLAO|nr:hypothetical protein [Chryseobacterium piperi]ASW75965.1 hypothetical protein CJF12_17955 [Chryseobacterium piperi]KFF17226.1 membrane protein [Chryseobacterium piperi]